jgi:hypothetical protein
MKVYGNFLIFQIFFLILKLIMLAIYYFFDFVSLFVIWYFYYLKAF